MTDAARRNVDFAIEGAGSYSAGLAGFLVGARRHAARMQRPRRAERGDNTSGLIDATLAAFAALRSGAPWGACGSTACVRTSPAPVRAARAMQTARPPSNRCRTILVTAGEGMRARLRRLAGGRLARRMTRLAAEGREYRSCRRPCGNWPGASRAQPEIDELDSSSRIEIIGPLVPKLVAGSGMGPSAPPARRLKQPIRVERSPSKLLAGTGFGFGLERRLEASPAGPGRRSTPGPRLAGTHQLDQYARTQDLATYQRSCLASGKNYKKGTSLCQADARPLLPPAGCMRCPPWP